MLRLYLIIALSTAFWFLRTTASGDGCTPLPISHFQWLNADGSLVIPQPPYDDEIGSQGEEDCCCEWRSLPESPSCQYCSCTNSLVCHGSDVYDVPNPVTLPNNRLSMFKMSGVGLISLPPKSFTGLSIQKLVIENSNLSYVASDAFSGVKSIEAIYLRKNTLDYVSQADFLFHNIPNLKFLCLEDNGIKVLSSVGTANMYDLTYFSLAGNALYTMEVFFLQNSGLTHLDLRNVTFKLRNEDIKGTGLNKLPSSLNTIDLSRAVVTKGAIEKFMEQLKGKNVTTLSLSYLQSQFWSFWPLRHIKNALQHLSLKGTDLHRVFSSTTKERHISKSVEFLNIIELNLENCNISFFGSGETFKIFPSLSVLSLSGNQFYTLDLNFLFYLPRLIFIDFSNCSITYFSSDVKFEAQNLLEIDLSNSNLYFDDDDCLDEFFSNLPNLQMLSFCKTNIAPKVIRALQNLSNLQYLDASGMGMDLNPDLLPAFSDLFSNQNLSLTELHFTQNSFELPNEYSSFFSQLTSLEKLDISNNLIRELSDVLFAPSLKSLNASQNLITTWYFSFLKNGSQLQSLDVSNNQITYVSDPMIDDFYKLHSLSLDSNPLICHNKVVALVCSNIKNDTQHSSNHSQGVRTGSQNDTEIKNNNTQTLTLVGWKQYRCYDLLLHGFRQFANEKDCDEYYEEVSTTHKFEQPTTNNFYKQTTSATTSKPSAQKLTWNWEWTYLIVGPIVFVSALGSIVYMKWWNIRCFLHRYFSLKKARLLRKNGNLMAKPEVYYDVFVSYSDVDRAWVLDHLVPNMEGDGDVALCFHERDFQVGMSILENIIDCMDRSHALLLVVSSAFIYSKWCQFEMHLAQYRLIETFRDQLVLVLLEDIPRKARPQTLHHLMMTKTYLMWPQQPCKEDAYELFWRRLKRALRPNPNYTLTL